MVKCFEFLSLNLATDRKRPLKRKESTMKSILIFVVLVGLMVGVSAKSFAAEERIVVLETNQGVIEIKLMPKVAPKACENFIALVEKGYYNGTVFHRVIKGFMIQGGDPTATGRGGSSIWGKPFEDEVTPEVSFTKPGLLAMANAGPKTNGSQFFITTAETPWLDMKHTIFGEVISGYDVVERIENASTDSYDRPKAEQRIVKAYLK